jgi:hypothetical protein
MGDGIFSFLAFKKFSFEIASLRGCWVVRSSKRGCPEGFEEFF